MLEVRRHLHRHPDLSGEEHPTAAFIAGRLRDFGLAPEVGLDETAVLVRIGGTASGSRANPQTLLVRADIDALPIHEASDGRTLRSERPGVMHACGHDAHAAIAIGVAETLNRHREAFSGRVTVLFQPAEETISGAKRVLQEGFVAPGSFDAVLGLHVLSQLPVGTVGIREGAIYGSSDEIKIEILGRAGHGGLPHVARDPIPVAAAIISQIQTILTREISPMVPAVISFGQVHGGFAANAIADSVTINGTVRAFRPDVREVLLRRVAELSEAIASAARLEARTTLGSGCAPVVCDRAMVDLVASAADATPGAFPRAASRLPVADDVAEFMALAPGCYFMLGGRDPGWDSTPTHHHPGFQIDERCICLGAEVMTRAILGYFSTDVSERSHRPTDALLEDADLDPAARVVDWPQRSE